MTTPFKLLDVNEQATDAEIKEAYLRKVRDNPPDRDQALFQQIQEAYETVKDADARLNYALFSLPSADFNVLLDQAFHQDKPINPLSADDFLKLLNAGNTEKTILNAMTDNK